MSQLSSTSEREGIRKTPDTRETHWAPLRFYAELYVEHSRSDVWSYFSDLAKWRRWSPICCGCRLIDNGRLQVDSVLEIRFKVVGVTIRVPARVLQFNPSESMTWQGQKFGISANHTYRFIPHNHGTLLCNDETLFGTGFPLNRLITAWYRLGKVSSESLKGLRRELGETTSGTAR